MSKRASGTAGGANSPAFAIYVEKALCGKHIKSSKVRVSWQFAFPEDLVVHHLELKHSIVSGKREVTVDGDPEYMNKSLFQGTFAHTCRLGSHEVRVTVEDTFEGYLYDLVVDGVGFHRLTRKTVAELEALRTAKKEASAPTVKQDFAAFTGVSKDVLDGKKAEANLLGDDAWAQAAVMVPHARAPAGGMGGGYAPPAQPQQYHQPAQHFYAQPQQQQNAYGGVSAYHYQQPQQQPSQYNPFDALGGGSSSNPAPYYGASAPTQQSYYSQSAAPAYDPFSHSAAPPYDPFATVPPPMPAAPASSSSSSYYPTSTYPSLQQQSQQPPRAVYDPFA